MRETRTGRTTLLLLVLMSAGAARGLAQTNDAALTDEGVRQARRVVVSLADCRLVVMENDTFLGSFPVAVGAPETPSPVGVFTIVNRLDHPTYYAQHKVIPPGDRNPLGTRWLGLSIRGYGIHGTDQPRSIGHPRSHGCIRLRNRDIEALFEMLQPGDVVELLSSVPPDLAPLFASIGPATPGIDD
jgi:lipoprotein-anchoring transpeptidase ErfK/SrfK